jgi:hypothetical protein
MSLAYAIFRRVCPGETWNVHLHSLFSLVLNAPEADD